MEAAWGGFGLSLQGARDSCVSQFNSKIWIQTSETSFLKFRIPHVEAQPEVQGYRSLAHASNREL